MAESVHLMYLALALAAVVAPGWLLVLCWRHRQQAGALAIASVMLCVIVITGASGMLAFSPTDEEATFWFYVRYLGYAFVPVASLAAVVQLIGRGAWLTWPRLAPLLVLPTVMQLAIWTRPEQFLRPSFEREVGLTIWSYERGPSYFVLGGYGYLVSLVALGLLAVTSVRARGAQARRHVVTLLGLGVPLGVDLMAQMQVFNRTAAIVLVPLSMVVMAATLAFAVFRYRLIELPPVALTVLDSLADPVFVRDRGHRLVMVNQAFGHLLGRWRDDLVGRSGDEVLPAGVAGVVEDSGSGALRGGPGTTSEDVLVDASGRERTFLTTRTSCRGSHGEALVVGVMRDITERKRLEAERDEQFAALQAALGEVRTLQGLLPICSYCKKVRDDADSWSQIEHYLAAHTDAQFSHGICPECYERHIVPQLEEIKARQG